MTIPALALLAGLLPVALPQEASGELEFVRPVVWRGEILEDEDLSAVAVRGTLLVLGSDETTCVQVLRAAGDGAYGVLGNVELLEAGADDNEDVEVDIEAIAFDGPLCYAAGSHSLVRKKIDRDRSTAKNRARLQVVEREPSREGIFRFRLDEDGRPAAPIERIDLKALLEDDPLLGPFTAIAGKENGLDVEGLAVREGTLLVGLRGPVLRGNLATVVALDFNNPAEYELRHLDLGGRGIRELIAHPGGGLLLIAGPVGDAREPSWLYRWDGRDGIPGKDRTVTPPVPLAEIPAPDGGTPEGLAVIAAQAGPLLLFVYDSAARGAPALYRLRQR